MPLTHLLKRLEDFLNLVDPERLSEAEDIINEYDSEDELFEYLESQYGDFFLTLEVSKPVCRYGKDCYRKNAEHLKEFSHPSRYLELSSFSNHGQTKMVGFCFDVPFICGCSRGSQIILKCKVRA